MDGSTNTDFRSDAHRYRFRPSYGFNTVVGDFNVNAAFIREYHPLRQAGLQVGDIAGISPHFEFVNSGGMLDQASVQLTQNFNNDFLVKFVAEDFTVKNNEIYLILREQWNSNLLANFSLSKYYNANVEPLFNSKNRFGKARFKRTGVAVERSRRAAPSTTLGVLIDGRVRGSLRLVLVDDEMTALRLDQR